MSRSLKFALLVAQDLRQPTIIRRRGQCYVVEGKLDIGAVNAQLTIAVPWFFKELKRSPPDVYCREPWIRTGKDWHNRPPMCWVLGQLWRDAMSWKGKPVESIMTEGRQMLLCGVRNLVNRHYFAHLENLDSWQDEWDSWGHFDAGTREYEREKQGRR